MKIDPKTFQLYFKEVRNRYLSGESTEITFRTPLENFLKSYDKDLELIQEPRRTERVGAPDFKVYRKKVKVGYIETKDLGKNLDEALKSEQISNYRDSIDNIILTNYGRFILIRANQTPFDFNLFDLPDLDNSRFVISGEKIQEFLRLLETFFSYNLPTIRSAKELSIELSKKAKLLKELAKEQLEDDIKRVGNNGTPSSVYDFYEGTKEMIKDISVDACADAYAQTITYGLFLARINCPSVLDRNTAALYIPRSIGVIKRIFMNISGDSVPSNLSWIIDEAIEILNSSSIRDILSEIDARGKTDRDPFTFFYEDFLSAYDPEKKKQLGVYYTPRPIVSFIVNSINSILKDDFNRPNGFADDDVTVLDPAVGTGTFLWLIYTLTLVELKNKGLSGLIRKKIQDHILKDFFGLEILITPYIIAHLKLSLALKRWYYELMDNERNQIYLANTLEPFESHGLMPFMREISEESKTANELKLRKKILVITANPPYRGLSANRGKWIQELVKKGYTRKDGSKDDGYYHVDGHPLMQRNPKWLQDDYVKFIRFAQWKIDRAGEGIVGFITNHNYLDNPTFRGMRQSLIRSFNRIFILNLHGSSQKKEECPDGIKDENVFGIKLGVAIALFIKNKKFKDKKIFYADKYGKREDKYYWLDRHTVRNVEWKELKPKSPHYFFVPKDFSLQNEYEKNKNLTEIFEYSRNGIVTGQDSFFIYFDKKILRTRILKVFDFNLSDENLTNTYDLKSQAGRKLIGARKEVNYREDSIKPYGYRPFDTRFVYYENKFLWRSVEWLGKQFAEENIALACTNMLSSLHFSHTLVADKISDYCYLSNRTKESAIFFPLYILGQSQRESSNEKEKPSSENPRRPNLKAEFVTFVKEKYPNTIITPEHIFGYVYAVLHSPTYRYRYREFLKIDFPRIPFPNDYSVFHKISEIGKQLIDLHLMKTKLETNVKFDLLGSNKVNFAKFKNNQIHINSNQFFDNVSSKAWNFYIGGYQVLNKWLKSRKGRELDGVEIEQFMQIVEIINRTLEHMEAIDVVMFAQPNATLAD